MPTPENLAAQRAREERKNVGIFDTDAAKSRKGDIRDTIDSTTGPAIDYVRNNVSPHGKTVTSKMREWGWVRVGAVLVAVCFAMALIGISLQ